MSELDQNRAPIQEAMEAHVKKRTVAFDVPGHKQGKGNPMLREFLGDKCLRYDMNSRKDLDNLCHPVGVIREAEEIAAEAFGAGHAFFIVNGTTAAVQAMVMNVVRKEEKIILPRNVHRSAIYALILTGAIPVYVNPGVHPKLGIPLGMSLRDVEEAILKNPDAKAVFVNNPTYYGICSDLKGIVELAHKHNMKVIVDEAHGTHFYFKSGLPVNAMAAGADMAAVSMHKTGGSLTQSSFLLIQDQKQMGEVRQVLNLTHTTSSSYLLLVSLDITRKFLALHGEEVFSTVQGLTDYAREEINKIPGYYCFDEGIINGDNIYDFDATKLTIHTRGIGLAGIEVYDILRDEYDIQVELGDLGNILAIIGVGDSKRDIERLISALMDIQENYACEDYGMITYEYISPIVRISPQRAFYAPQKKVKIADSIDEIAGESIMVYPPGIPILAPGELITQEAIDYILYAKERGSFLTGIEDTTIEYINVLEV
ncbi:MAG: aminotransferase class V-fold PLP-dependent enzyme [Erysipelotrichaceae bacterium]